MKRISVNDVFDQIMERQRRWQNERRIGQVGYDEETGTICFYHRDEDDNERYFYWIKFDYLKSSRGQIEWLNHLRAKRWFNAKVFGEFMDVLEATNVLVKGVSLSTSEERRAA